MTPVAVYAALLTTHNLIFYHNEVSGKFSCLSKSSASLCISFNSTLLITFLQKPPGDLAVPTPVTYKQIHHITFGNLVSPSLFNIYVQFDLSKVLCLPEIVVLGDSEF